MKSLLVSIFLVLFLLPLQAQRMQAGEVSFLLNGEKIHLTLKSAELTKSNLIAVNMRGEYNGDTMVLFNMGFALKKLATGTEVVSIPSFHFTLMQNYKAAKRMTQTIASRDGKSLNIVEKKGDKSENINFNMLSHSVEIKKVELKDGILTLVGEFKADYETPKEAPMQKKHTISDGKFSIQF